MEPAGHIIGLGGDEGLDTQGIGHVRDEPPVVEDALYEVREDGALVVSFDDGVLMGATDVNGDPLEAELLISPS